MTLYITEAEMLERFIDANKKAASRAQEITEAEEKKKPGLFVEFVNSVKVAAGSAHQLAHAQENAKWLDVRDLLENIVTVSMSLPQKQQDVLWIRIKEFLIEIADSGRKLATMRSMTRKEVLENIDHRSTVANTLQ